MHVSFVRDPIWPWMGRKSEHSQMSPRKNCKNLDIDLRWRTKNRSTCECFGTKKDRWIDQWTEISFWRDTRVLTYIWWCKHCIAESCSIHLESVFNVIVCVKRSVIAMKLAAKGRFSFRVYVPFPFLSSKHILKSMSHTPTVSSFIGLPVCFPLS